MNKTENIAEKIFVELKKCTKCGIEKSFSEFYKSTRGKFGLESTCKECRKKDSRNNRLNNTEYYMEYRKQRNKNPDVIQARKEYYQKNKEEKKKYIENNKEKRKEYLEKNKEKIKARQKEYDKKYREENKEKIKEYKYKNKDHDKEWREKNKERVNKQKNSYEKNRKKSDESFKLKLNIKNLFRRILKDNSLNKKQQSFFKYTGITYAEYIEYFKTNFPVEFSEITEKGKYHIDHIIPCAIYDFNNPDEIKKCWNPLNLRLIPAMENIIKKDKLDLSLVERYNIKHLLPERLKNEFSIAV